ncbi:MAG: glycosyltransferase [Desulfovibrionaceae bacterium]
MNIAYCIGGLPYGGVESWLFDLATLLKRRPDVKATIINVSGTGIRHNDFVAAGFDVRCVGDSTDCLKTSRLGTARTLRALIRDMAPDIVHTVHFSADYFARLACLGLDVPVITHIRNIKHERKFHRRLANKLLSFRTDLYLAVSQGAADTIRTDHNLARRPVKVVYNAIDLDKLHVPPAPLPAPPAGLGPCKTILAVSRLVAQKNYPFLVRALARVAAVHPAIQLVIVGEGNERDRILAEAQACHIADRVHLLGYRTDVPALMQAADIFAMPSLYEGLPIAHLEAMGCGLPAVISEHVPSKEISGGSAFVCPLDEAAFADKLLALATDNTLHATMRAAALAKAQDFSMTRHAENLLEIYRSLCSGRT